MVAHGSSFFLMVKGVQTHQSNDGALRLSSSTDRPTVDKPARCALGDLATDKVLGILEREWVGHARSIQAERDCIVDVEDPWTSAVSEGQKGERKMSSATL